MFVFVSGLNTHNFDQLWTSLIGVSCALLSFLSQKHNKANQCLSFYFKQKESGSFLAEEEEEEEDDDEDDEYESRSWRR